jgi:hypothetical protein
MAERPPRNPKAPRGRDAGQSPGSKGGTAVKPHPPRRTQPSRNVLYLPLALTGGVGLLGFLPRVLANPRLTVSFWAAAALLLVWTAALAVRLRSGGEGRSLEIVVRKQHWIQACVQLSVYGYWGWYWRPVYEYAGLFLAQLAFAYAFDMLLAWSRRESYTLGFGPFPIVFSTNLFIWFKDDWFYLQFLMLAIGFLGKEFVRWEREGKRVHIFNPSAFTLGLFSLVLIATGTTDLTWGPEIASTLTLAPYIYTYLFAVGLVCLYFFSITMVTGAAAGVLFLGSWLYASVTGVPFFLDSEIPAAVFLGLHLLVTDPSTSPRTPEGKLVFGALYGAGVLVLYGMLSSYGVPTHYDKLLCVPLLNLSIRGIDALVTKLRGSDVWSRARIDWAFGRPNLAHMSIWVVFFLAMTAAGRTDGRHTGDSLPFWEQACAEGRPTACQRLLRLEATYCGDASAWACNELGIAYAEGRLVGADSQISLGYFSRACELRFQPACVNLLDPDGAAAHGDPRVLDLRLLLREGGRNRMDDSESELYERACEHGWTFACSRVASAL